MSASWVAGSVRGRAMSRRRLGAGGARDLAALATLADAVQLLSTTPYGHDVRPGMTLPEAQRAVSATVLWHLRVLAGWVPHGDARVLRVLAGAFEVANTDEHVRTLSGVDGTEPPFALGSLATAWPRIAAATSLADVREALSRSPWGDPGEATPRALHAGMRLAWAARVNASVPGARDWAAGGAAVLVARECVVAAQRLTPETARVAESLLGPGWAEERSLPGLARVLPREARWALSGVQEPADLWRAEATWWDRVGRDGAALLARPLTSQAPVVGAAAVLAADAWRVRAALEVAARGGAAGTVGGTRILEAFDAVA